jgi:hypothetical protein
VVPGAAVVVENQGTKQTVNLITSRTGSFIAPELPVGVYRLRVSMQGFETELLENVQVSVSSRVSLVIRLRPGHIRQTVTVTSGSPIIDTASTAPGSLITATEAEELPTNGRDLSQLVELVPGVTLAGGPGMISGQNMNSNGGDGFHFLMDGADASRIDSTTLDNSTGFGQNRITRASIDDVEEVTVYQNMYSAEYGGGLGGVINIITKSGTNQFHGGLFEFFRNGVLDARDYFDPAPSFKPPLRLNQYGGNLGGPIKRDKIFFFVNYEGIRQTIGTTISGYVPTAAYRATFAPAVQPAVNMLPLPNGPVSSINPNTALYTAEKPNVLNEDTVGVKLGYNFTPSKRLDFRYNMEHAETLHVFGIAEGQTQEAFAFNQSAKLGYTQVFSSSSMNEVGFAFNRVHLDNESTTDPAISSFPIVTILGLPGVGPAFFETFEGNNSFSGLDTVDLVRGHHELKFGTQIERVQVNKAVGFQESELYLTLQDFANNSPTSVSTIGDPRSGLRNTYSNFFVQDDFRVSRRLSLSGGLRYQYDTAPSESHGRIANFNFQTGTLDPRGAQVLNAPTLNFAPRIGVAYSPFASDHTVLRAGFGIFYTDLIANQEAQNIPGNLGEEDFSLNNIQQPGLMGFPFPTITQFAAVTALWAVQRDWKIPYLESWTLSIQQELSPNTRLEVAYVGNHGVHQIGPPADLNRFTPAGTTNRPYPQFASIYTVLPRGISSYDALDVSLHQRFAGRHFLNVNYTYSHCLDDIPMLFAGYQNEWDPLLDYGNCEGDVRHQLEVNYIYSIPGVPRVPRVLGSGWKAAGITTMRSGFPFSVHSFTDPFQYGDNTEILADVVPGVPRRPSNFSIPSNQLNPAAFTNPGPFTYGNSGRNSLFGPSMINFDFSLMRSFQIRENKTLEFRAEFYNIFNTPQFANGFWAVGVPGFGQSTSTITTADAFGTYRQIQFALKYAF